MSGVLQNISCEQCIQLKSVLKNCMNNMIGFLYEGELEVAEYREAHVCKLFDRYNLGED